MLRYYFSNRNTEQPSNVVFIESIRGLSPVNGLRPSRPSTEQVVLPLAAVGVRRESTAESRIVQKSQLYCSVAPRG
jgi:hypothetical protein